MIQFFRKMKKDAMHDECASCSRKQEFGGVQIRFAKKLLTVLLFVSGLHMVTAQSIFDNWRIRIPNPPANTLQTALYAEGQFIAAGQHATVVTSTTGNVWETQYLKPEFNAMALVYAKERYVMVDRNGQVAVSSDLQAWRTAGIGASSLKDLIYAEDRFITVGRLSGIYISEDGDTWIESRIAEESHDLEAIAFGDGSFVTIARGGKVFRSSDLEEWTEVFEGFPGTENMTDNWEGMVRFGNHFVAYGPVDRLLVSENGTDWSEIQLAFESSLTDHVIWKDQLWLSGNSDAILHSSDGLAWERISLGVDVSANAIAASPERIIALARRGEVYSSDDGEVWTKVIEREYDTFAAMAYKDGVYIAIADKKRFLRSVDGVNWDLVLDAQDGSDLYEGIGTVGGRFVAVAARGSIAWSDDGLEWNTETEVEFSAIVRGLSTANGVLFAGCDSGYLASTSNGLDWVEQKINETASGNQERIEDVSYFNGYYFAPGGDGFLARSADLQAWEVLPLGDTTARFKKLLFFNNRYILLPVSGSRVLFSDDLVSWSDNRRVPVIRATGAGIYEDQVVVSSIVGVYTSTDGETFTEHPLPTGGFRAIVFDGNQYVAAGSNGVIATTGDNPLSALQLTIAGNGNVSRSPDQALYDSSTVIRLTAEPADGHQFLWWETADGVDDSPTIDLVLQTDTNVQAVFAGLTPPEAALLAGAGKVSLQWPRDDGWVLHDSVNLSDWARTPVPETSDEDIMLDITLPPSGQLFFQFRLRSP
jgi:hypothetical protein